MLNFAIETIVIFMRKFTFIAAIAFLAACSNAPKTGTFGEKFENKGSQDFKTALADYTSGKDTTYVIEGQIDNVCSHSGCWISFKNDTSEFYVNTNEKFTMPKDSKGKKAIAKGRFVKDEEGTVSFEPTGVIIE